MSVLVSLGLMLSVSLSSILVDAKSLAELDNSIIVDARDPASFESGHIPGATNLSVDSLSEERDGVVGMLMPMEALIPLFAKAGLETDKPIVVYSGLYESSELKQATRLFWALEYAGFSDVKLLDGGLAAWEASGRPLIKGATKRAPTEVGALTVLRPATGRIATRDDVMKARLNTKTIVADLRSKENFTGASKKDFIARGGHVDGAESQPADSFVEGSDHTFKTPDVIRALLDASKNARDKSVVTYCNTGRDATIGYVAYRIAGFDQVAVYDGSMAEWGNQADCPMSEGTEE